MAIIDTNDQPVVPMDKLAALLELAVSYGYNVHVHFKQIDSYEPESTWKCSYSESSAFAGHWWHHRTSPATAVKAMIEYIIENKK